MVKLSLPRTVEWMDGNVKMINQLLLPWKLEYIVTDNYERVADAIKRMEVRGAPAIGVAAAFAMALAALKIDTEDVGLALKKMEEAKLKLANTRPTAINLFWALERIHRKAVKSCNVDELKRRILKEAMSIAREDEEVNRKIGEHGEPLINDGSKIITVCNAGSLATSYFGTALAPIYTAWMRGKQLEVIVMETRPYMQGSRLTAWELSKAGIPVKVITDNSIGIVVEREKVDLAFVGADRVTKDGYIINKIGTYPLALVCREKKIPVFSFAPTSTIDPSKTIKEVEIEKRPSEEVIFFMNKRLAPEGVEAIYYAFDVTPPNLVEGIVTEKGILRQPLRESISKLIK